MQATMRPSRLIAAGLGTGFAPEAPGTAGSLLGLVIGTALLQHGLAPLALGTVAATVFHLDPEPDGGCGDLSGWHFWVTDVDGGLIDAGVGYTSGLAIANGTVTTGTGIALIYNLEPAVQNVRLLATKVADALPDGGTLCPNVPDTPSFQMIGTFPVRGEAFTVAPYVVP